MFQVEVAFQLRHFGHKVNQTRNAIVCLFKSASLNSTICCVTYVSAVQTLVGRDTRCRVEKTAD
jgi:hypothetical protein